MKATFYKNFNFKIVILLRRTCITQNLFISSFTSWKSYIELKSKPRLLIGHFFGSNCVGDVFEFGVYETPAHTYSTHTTHAGHKKNLHAIKSKKLTAPNESRTFAHLLCPKIFNYQRAMRVSTVSKLLLHFSKNTSHAQTKKK